MDPQTHATPMEGMDHPQDLPEHSSKSGGPPAPAVCVQDLHGGNYVQRYQDGQTGGLAELRKFREAEAVNSWSINSRVARFCPRSAEEDPKDEMVEILESSIGNGACGFCPQGRC